MVYYEINMLKIFDKLLNSPFTYMAVAISGFLFIYFIPMKWGACVMGGDSLCYLTAARELTNGQGLYVLDRMGGFDPLIHFPPGFPIILAIFSIIKINPDEAARLLNAILFAANSFAIGYLLRVYGPRLSYLPIIGMCTFIVSTTVLKVHANYLSEPLFIFCLLMTFIFLLKYQATNSKIILALSATFAGYGLLTRYIGVTLIIAGIILIFIHHRKYLKSLIIDSSIFAVISFVPMFLWLFRNRLLTGTQTDRVMEWHPPDYGNWLVLKSTIINWFVPSSSPSTIKTIIGFIAFAFIIAVLIFWKAKLHAGNIELIQTVKTKALLRLNFLFLLCYSLFLLCTIFFIDKATNPDERLMFPVYFAGLLILIIALGDLLINTKINWQRNTLLFAFCIFFMAGIVRSSAWAYVVQKDGWGGYNQPERCFSETIAFLRKDTGIDFSKVISNDCGAIYFGTQKSTIEIPVKYYTFYRVLPLGAKVGDKRFDFEDNWRKMKNKIAKESLIVYFLKPMASGAFVFPSENELKKRLRLTLLHQFRDGKIYLIE